MPRPLVPCLAALASVLAVAFSAPAQQRPAAPSPPSATGRVTRAPDGSPGPGYWQQQVDYALEATLDPVSRRLTGRGTVTYHNNSPDTLAELRWHLYQNLFRDGGAPASVVGRAMARTRGIEITALDAEGQPLTREVRGTLMRTPLPVPLAPGDSLRLGLAWTLEVPAVASLRTGSEGEDFGIAQWYPQVSTYDDVHGWHDLPYRGQGEFYLEYGNWDVRLTLPRRFLVAATGTLQNPEAVLAPVQAAALRGIASAPVGTLTRVVSAADTGGRAVPAGATRSWHFTAERVRDFAWAASPRFVWNATRTAPLAARPGGVLIHSFYAAPQAGFYEQSWAVAQGVIELFSRRFGDYVYPQATVVSGPVLGMEYPMLAFEGVESRVINMPEGVTVHELGHQWYPMMIGSNETRHAFMDEGFTTFIEMEWFRTRYGRGGFWSARMPAWARGLLGRGDYRRLTYMQATLPQTRATVPLMTPADDVPEAQLGAVAYQKPAAALVLLRDVVGDGVLDAALREYHRRWLYRHPYPEDFFRTVESVAGRDLGWLWRPWFYEARPLDLGVTGVRSAAEGGRWRAMLALANPTAVPVPVTARLTLENGVVRDVRLPETQWAGVAGGGTNYAAVIPDLPAPVQRVELDPEQLLLDVARANNVWPAGAPSAAGPLFGVTRWRLAGLLALAVLSAVLVRAVGLYDGLRLSGFRPARYALGGLSLWSARRGLHVGRVRRPRLYGAGVLALPRGDAHFERGMASLVSAGPLASLLAAVVILAIVYLLERRYDAGLRAGSSFHVDAALFLIGVATLVSFLRVLPPRRARGAYIPSAPWVRLLRSPDAPAMQRWAAMRALLAQSFVGARPRAWSAAWVEQATALHDGSAAEAGACMLAYLWALDRGDTPEAGSYLERARAAVNRRWWRFRLRRHVNAETVFYTTYLEGDAAEGARLFRATNARRGPPHVRHRVRAALLVADAQLARAGIEARRGLLANERTEAWGGAGIATFERYWLAVLLAAADQRVGSAVVTPSLGSVAVLVGERPRRWRR